MRTIDVVERKDVLVELDGHWTVVQSIVAPSNVQVRLHGESAGFVVHNLAGLSALVEVLDGQLVLTCSHSTKSDVVERLASSILVLAGLLVHVVQ